MNALTVLNSRAYYPDMATTKDELRALLPAWELRQDPDGTCRAKYEDIEITAASWDQLKQNVKSFVALQWF